MRCTCSLWSQTMAASLRSEQNKRMIPESRLLSSLSSNRHRCRLSHRSAFHHGPRWFLFPPRTLPADSLGPSWLLHTRSGLFSVVRSKTADKPLKQFNWGSQTLTKMSVHFKWTDPELYSQVANFSICSSTNVNSLWSSVRNSSRFSISSRSSSPGCRTDSLRHRLHTRLCTYNSQLISQKSLSHAHPLATFSPPFSSLFSPSPRPCRNTFPLHPSAYTSWISKKNVKQKHTSNFLFSLSK